MEKNIGFTLVTSKDPLNKLFKSDGSKESRGEMYSGNYRRIDVGSIEKLFNGHEGLSQRQAITLGVTKQDKGTLTTRKNVKNGSISRTKDNFSFAETAFLLLDYDPSKNGFTIESPEYYVEVLRDIDPDLKYCDIGVRYGSSYGIMKDGVLISDKKSLHAYIIVENATDEKVIQYKDYLVSNAWAKGYGHIELSKVGSIMRRQVFDAAVFSPERLVFESAPTLEDGITRDVPKYYISLGEKKMKNLNNIPPRNAEGEKRFSEAKLAIKKEADTIKGRYIEKEIDKRVVQGMSKVTAGAIVESRVEDRILLPEDSILGANKKEILVSDIMKNQEKYNKMYIPDLLEPEKGSNKAIINAENGVVFIHSFLHGGFQYKVVTEKEKKIKKKKEIMEEKSIKINQFSNIIIEKLTYTGEFECEEIVEQILNTGIPLTSYFANVYIYTDNYWRKHENEDIEKKIFVKACVKKIIGKRPSKQQIESVHRELLMEYIDMPITQEILINFSDGILKINNGNFEKILHNPEYRKLYKLGFSYNPATTCPLTDKFCLDVMGSQETVDLFFEFIGSCFISNDHFKLEKALFLYGSGSNGKSVLLDLLRELFGRMNISTVALKDMGTPERRHSMVGKLLNIASEGSSRKFDSEDFKAIVTREPLPVRVMYDNATDTNDFPRLVFATNNMPYTGGDVSHGLLRRIIIIEFDKVIAEEDQDKQLLEKLKPELSGVMNRVLEGMMRLLKNGRLTKSAKVDKTLEKYEMQINPVKYFVDEFSLQVAPTASIYCSTKLYEKFKQFCIDVGIHQVNKRNFSGMMKNVFGEIQHSNTLYGWRIIEQRREELFEGGSSHPYT